MRIEHTIDLIIDEIALSGHVCLPKCSRSTAYRWVDKCKEYLKDNNLDWSVKLDTSDPKSYMITKI